MKASAILLLSACAAAAAAGDAQQSAIAELGMPERSHRRSLLRLQGGRWRQLDDGPGEIKIRAGTGAEDSKSWYKDYSVPSEGAIVSFQVRFEEDFEWSCRGKVAGLTVGNGASTGCSHSKNGASLRFMWETENAPGGRPTPFCYVYVPSGTRSQQPGELQDSKRCGQNLFQGSFPTLQTEQWYDVELGIRLNTPGQADGALLMSIGGQTEEIAGVMWRTGDQALKPFRLQPFHGGPCKASRGSGIEFRDVRVKSW